MTTKIEQEVLKRWAVYYLANQGTGPRICLERFATRGDAEVYLFKLRKYLPKSANPQLTQDCF